MQRAAAAEQRYFQAFEDGTLDPQQCALRVRALQDQLESLRSREAELASRVEQGPLLPSDEAAAVIRETVLNAISNGAPTHRKQLMHALVDHVRIDARDAIFPVFRLPDPRVRAVNRTVHTAAKAQIRADTPGRTHYRRKLAGGKSESEALRSLKRQLSDVVYRRLCADQRARGERPGVDRRGRDQKSA